MEQLNRKPAQGVLNIIQFNYHYFLIVMAAGILLLFLKSLVPENFQGLIIPALTVILTITFVSLLVSYYVYDKSGLYHLKWMEKFNIRPEAKVVNINAGFDETSHLIKQKYPRIELQVLDFYDERSHTEVSIRRARKKYKPYPGTKHIKTDGIFLQKDSVDFVFCILSAHEIRNNEERTIFFNQLKNSLSANGKIIVVEHLRDTFNALAYTFGVFHFHGNATWKATFKNAGLTIEDQVKLTPFLTIYTLTKNGNTP